MASNVSRRLCAKISSHFRPGIQLNPPGPSLHVISRASLSSRSLSTTSGGKGSGSGKSKDADTEDPFGVNFEDGETNIGPKDSLPPNYVRDSATGKFTGEIKVEASEEDKRLLSLGPIGNEYLLKQRFEQSIEKNTKEMGKTLGVGGDDDGDDGEGETHSLENIARRIREERGALRTIGRKVSDVERALSEERYDSNADETTAPLTEKEMDSLYKFIDMNDMSSDDSSANTDKIMGEVKELNLIPNINGPSTSPDGEIDEDNPDLDVSWMTMKSQRSMMDIDAEDMESPFSNLMPVDFDPANKVNRKRAKPIPKELIHHNNLALVRRYVTPGGQIMKRVQTRLGAKDQRKMAKLIKRARHLGLIPFIGQWKVEDHGNIKDPSLFEDKDWEKRLLERGLVTRQSPLWEEKMMKKSSDPSAGW